MRRFVLILIASASLAAVACTRQTDVFTLPQTDADVTGAFNLTTANGRTLPYTAIVTLTEQQEVVSDQIVILANNTWVDSTSYINTSLVDGSTSTSSTASAGTYKVADGKITFIMTQGGTTIFAGAVTGSTLTVLFNGQPFVYMK
ncbi:MAG TPA: hypothetical protein VN706_23445 [Gemmatimonadaceae bacterium]|nr:hypothetical protein [Gemmatimonadaceae bacterium]